MLHVTRLIDCRFLNPGETITTEKYCQQVNEMRKKLLQKITSFS